MIVTAPLALWVMSVHVETGADVASGSAVVDLDGYGIERQLAKLRSKLELIRVSETRLSDDYLKRYVYPPMDELVKVRREEATFHERFLIAQQSLATAGQIPRAGVIGQETSGSLALAEHDAFEARMGLATALDERQKKTSEVEEERVKNASQIEEATKSIAIFEAMRNGRGVRSPKAGKVTIHVAPGQFVDKGDALFEVS